MKKTEISKERKLYLKKQRNKKFLIIGIQIFLLILLFGMWELLTYTKVLDPFYFSSPSRMVNTLGNLIKDGSLFYHIGITLYEAVLGFAISMILGFIIAVVLWWSDTIRRILDPYIVVINSLPKIALGQIIIIWFGAGTKAIVVMAILILIVITILSTILMLIGSLFINMQVAAELAIFGTFTSFVIVCIGILILRKTEPNRERPFKVPCCPWFPIIGAVFCSGLMFVALREVKTSAFLFPLWLVIGIVIYFMYGYQNSRKEVPLKIQAESQSEENKITTK